MLPHLHLGEEFTPLCHDRRLERRTSALKEDGLSGPSAKSTYAMCNALPSARAVSTNIVAIEMPLPLNDIAQRTQLDLLIAGSIRQRVNVRCRTFGGGPAWQASGRIFARGGRVGVVETVGISVSAPL